MAQACQCQLLQVHLGDPEDLEDQLLQVHLENLGHLSGLADLAGRFHQASLSQQDQEGLGVPVGLEDPCHLGGLEFQIHFLPSVHLHLGYLALPSHQGVPLAPELLEGLVVLACQGQSVLQGRGCRVALVALLLLGVQQVQVLLSRHLVLLLLAFLVDLALLAFPLQRTQVVLGDQEGLGDLDFQILAFLQDLVVLLVQQGLGDQGALVPPLPAHL